MKKALLIIGAFCAVAFITFSSFDDAQTDEQRIATSLQAKIDEYNATKTAECEAKAREAATVKADSLVSVAMAAKAAMSKGKKGIAITKPKPTPKGTSNTKPTPAPSTPAQTAPAPAPKTMKEKMEEAKNKAADGPKTMKEKMEEAKQDATKKAAEGKSTAKTMKEKMEEAAAAKKAAGGGK